MITTTEITLRKALQMLLAEQKLTKNDSNNPFFRNLASKEDYTPAQLRAVRSALEKYELFLATININLPTKQEVEDVAKDMKPQARKITRAEINVNDGFIFIHVPFQMNEINAKVRAEHNKYREEFGAEYCGTHNKYSQEARYGFHNENGDKYWRVPYTRKTFELLTQNQYFNTSSTIFSPSARAVLKEMQQEKINAAYKSIKEAEENIDEFNALLALINVDGEFLPGKKLYAHQKSGINFLLSRERGLIGDDAGLGKTATVMLPALALQRRYAWDIIIVTTLSSQEDWIRIARSVGAKINIYTWQKMPVASNENPNTPFIFIADEAQRMQSLTSAQTKASLALAWHYNCKRFFPISATPISNGRPINALGLLLGLKHALVYVPFDIKYPIAWSKKYNGTEDGTKLPQKMIEKIRRYERDFCGAHLIKITSRRVWDNTGATNKDLFYRYTRYVENEQNHPWTCMLQRRKGDCTDLPAKQRIMAIAEVPPEVAKEYGVAIAKGVQEYWKRCEEKLAEWIETYKQDHNDVMPAQKDIVRKREGFRSAESVVLNGLHRHLSEKTKIAYSVQKALLILDQGEKVVIFCEFVDCAKEIGSRIEEATGRKDVGYILGEIDRVDRVRTQDDFQDPNGSIRVVISTAAGGEAITLNAACYMVLVSRPWTPGGVDQRENRCDRLGRLGGNVQVTVYWVQLPEKISEIDVKVDEILENKLININQMRYGETEGFTFAEDEDINAIALKILLNTAKKNKKEA